MKPLFEPMSAQPMTNSRYKPSDKSRKSDLLPCHSFVSKTISKLFLVYPHYLYKTKQYWSHVHLIFMLIHGILSMSPKSCVIAYLFVVFDKTHAKYVQCRRQSHLYIYFKCTFQNVSNIINITIK